MLEDQLIKRVAQQTQTQIAQVQAALTLFDEGCTVPFVARYRKERTRGLDEVQLRAIQTASEKIAALEKRRQSILDSLEEQGVQTADLLRAIKQAQELTTLEDLYAPYRPKRKTRATKAIDAGLEPLLEKIIRGETANRVIESFCCDDYPDADAVVQGVQDIFAERLADNAEAREYTRGQIRDYGKMLSKKRRGAEENPTYKMYLEFSQPVKYLKPHQTLAMRRGDKEKALSIKTEIDDERARRWLDRSFNPARANKARTWLLGAIEDGYKRLLYPAAERDIWAKLEAEADQHAIDVFALNLKNLLLQPPMTNQCVLGLDPGYRTGCKIAIVGATGNVLATDILYIHDQRKKLAPERLSKLVQRHKVDVIAIGNGTASRETEEVVATCIRDNKLDTKYTIVSEAGASVYSASELAREELPNMDVSYRGAVSIARRLQDPLAELVKIDPKSIGVGLYQHDVNQNELTRALDAVVEDVVNAVGVDLNTSSAALLTYISGLNTRTSKNIVAHREKNGAFKSRKELKKVKGLGDKSFEQSAGFLRVRDGKQPLDNTSIHPENYPFAQALLKALGVAPGDAVSVALRKFDDQKLNALAQKHDVGPMTLRDILEDLQRPGRDPRQSLDAPVLRADVMSLDDLHEGMILTGTVRNVVDFGAFVDVGLKHDGLVHISEMANRFVRNPHDVVAVGDRVEVMVIDIDTRRGRVGLSIKRCQ